MTGNRLYSRKVLDICWFRWWKKNRAGDGTQTRDPQLGRLMLYQLSYSRLYFLISADGNVGRAGFEPTKAYASRFTVCPSWPLWYLPENYNEFHSGSKHPTLELPCNFKNLWAECQIRTDDPEITNHVLWPTELIRQVGKLPTSHRCDHLPLLPSGPGGIQQELIVQDLPAAKVEKKALVPN